MNVYLQIRLISKALDRGILHYSLPKNCNLITFRCKSTLIFCLLGCNYPFDSNSNQPPCLQVFFNYPHSDIPVLFESEAASIYAHKHLSLTSGGCLAESSKLSLLSANLLMASLLVRFSRSLARSVLQASFLPLSALSRMLLYYFNVLTWVS